MKSIKIISAEGKINNIPKISKTPSHILQLNYSPNKYKNVLHNYYLTKREKSPKLNIIKLDFKKNYKLNEKLGFNKYRFKINRTDSNSTTSVTTNTDKIKKVTFSTVEIIRIKNYKQSNKSNSYKIEDFKKDRNNLNNKDYCQIF